MTEFNNYTLSVIGAIVVIWSSIEKTVISSIVTLERYEDKRSDLSKLRDFKGRKGRLRILVAILSGPRWNETPESRKRL